MIRTISCSLLSLFSIALWSQTVTFVDEELQRYLVNELCVDTSGGLFFGNHRTVDLNNDGNIQISEAEQVLRLDVTDLGNYSIKSLMDLNAFINLEYLRVINLDSLTEVANLNLTNLKTLWIGTCYGLRRVDISNLAGLTDDLRIEDIDTLDYLNIQNGNVPLYFSLFYSDNIHYACVDSIAAEYNEVAWKMTSGLPVIENCTVLNTIGVNSQKLPIQLFPNPTNGVVELSFKYDHFSIYSLNGTMLMPLSFDENQIDITNFKSGIYFFIFESNGKLRYEKVVKL